MRWQKIKEVFKGQWVELANFEWDWDSAVPTTAQVVHHAQDREELLQMIEESGAAQDGVILYVGDTQPMIEHDRLVWTNTASA